MFVFFSFGFVWHCFSFMFVGLCFMFVSFIVCVSCLCLSLLSLFLFHLHGFNICFGISRLKSNNWFPLQCEQNSNKPALLFSFTRRYRSDVSHSVSQSVTQCYHCLDCCDSGFTRCSRSDGVSQSMLALTLVM